MPEYTFRYSRWWIWAEADNQRRATQLAKAEIRARKAEALTPDLTYRQRRELMRIDRGRLKLVRVDAGRTEHQRWVDGLVLWALGRPMAKDDASIVLLVRSFKGQRIRQRWVGPSIRRLCALGLVRGVEDRKLTKRGRAALKAAGE